MEIKRVIITYFDVARDAEKKLNDPAMRWPVLLDVAGAVVVVPILIGWAIVRLPFWVAGIVIAASQIESD